MSLSKEELLFIMKVRDEALKVLRQNGVAWDQMGQKAKKAGDQGSASMKKVEGSARSMGRAVSAAFTAITAALGTASLINYSDTFKLMEGRLSLVTENSANLARVQERLFQSANETRSSYEALSTLYAGIARASEMLGASQEQLLLATETVSKAFVVSGASAGAAQAAIIQLQQALGSGQLRGDELNSILEQAPRLAQAVAESMGVYVGQLKSLAQEGKLTSKQVLEAILASGGEIAAEFERIPTTIAQAITIFNNYVLKFVGEMDKATGISQVLIDVIIGLAKNLDILVPILGAVAVAMGALFVFLNPWLALGVAIVAAAAALVAFADKIHPVEGSAATLADYLRVLIKAIGDFIDWLGEAWNAAKKFFDGLGDWAMEADAAITASFLTIGDVVGQIFEDMWENAKRTFSNIGQAVRMLASGDFEGFWASITAKNEAAYAGIEAGKIFDKNFNEVLKELQERRQQTSTKGAWTLAAEQIAKDRAMTAALSAREPGGPSSVSTTLKPGKKATDPDAEKAAKKAEDQFKKTLANIMEEINAINMSADAYARRAAVIQAGLDPDKQYVDGSVERTRVSEIEAAVMKRLAAERADFIADANKEAASIRANIDLVQMSTREREIELAVREEALKRSQANKTLSEEEAEALRNKARAQQEYNDALAQEDRLRDLGDEIAMTRELIAVYGLDTKERLIQEAIIKRRHDLMKEGRTLGAEEIAQLRELVGLQYELGEMSMSTSETIHQTLKDWSKDAMDLGKQVADEFIKGFEAMEDAVVEFAMTGKVSFKDFANSVIEDIIRILVRTQITGPLAGMLSGMFGGTSSPVQAGSATAAEYMHSSNSSSGGWLGSILSGLGNILSGAFAEGGTAYPNRAYLIGERGPELFVPSTSGTVISNDNLMGGRSSVVNVSVQVNVDKSGNAVSEVSTDNNYKELGDRMARVAREVIADEQRPGGSLYKALA
jgi:tape measure domain-containing protein